MYSFGCREEFDFRLQFRYKVKGLSLVIESPLLADFLDDTVDQAQKDRGMCVTVCVLEIIYLKFPVFNHKTSSLKSLVVATLTFQGP